VKGQKQAKSLEDRLANYPPDEAAVIKQVLYQEQRKLGLKNPKDIVNLIEGIIDEVVGRAEQSKLDTEQ
jgi:hypothetical protein